MRYILVLMTFFFTPDEHFAVVANHNCHIEVKAVDLTGLSCRKIILFDRLQSKIEEKPQHLLAKAAAWFAFIGAAALVLSMILAFSSGFLLFEFGYFSLHLATSAILFSLRALSDMNNEPEKWSGRKKAKGSFIVGITIGIGVFLWMLIMFAAQ